VDNAGATARPVAATPLDIFVRLLADDRRRDGPDAALTAVESAAALAARDPEGARERLREAGRRHGDLFGIGCAFHDVYRAAFEALHRRPSAPSGDVRVVRCVELGASASLRALQRAVRRAPEPLVLVRCGEHPRVAGAADELEALALLADEPGLGMVVIGEHDALVRRELLQGGLRSDRAIAVDAVVGTLARIVRDAGMAVRVGPA
jgi:hypothetical protein